MLTIRLFRPLWSFKMLQYNVQMASRLVVSSWCPNWRAKSLNYRLMVKLYYNSSLKLSNAPVVNRKINSRICALIKSFSATELLVASYSTFVFCYRANLRILLLNHSHFNFHWAYWSIEVREATEQVEILFNHYFFIDLKFLKLSVKRYFMLHF